MQQANARVKQAILAGMGAEWALSNDKTDELIWKVFGKRFNELPTRTQANYLRRNEAALVSFRSRETNGLTLSKRVWALTEQNRREIELGLSVALENGTSATELARELKKYLNEPNRLFRRIRDKYGNLTLSKAAKAYHPGPGVYRSSYKNAMRLARTEINMAYRTADHDRWQRLDFVVGIRISISNNHPVPDICDDLTGDYPKDFKFVGWHPACRCLVVPILKTEEELVADTDKILSGESTNTASANEVTDVPSNFKEWVNKNRERIQKASSEPYFIRDNRETIHRITDEQFILDHFKDYAIEATTSTYISAKSFNLTPAETLAVRVYTEEYYETINNALWNNVTSEEVDRYSRVLNRALDKLDVYRGEVFRGAPLTATQLEEYRKYAKNGLPMIHPGFTSTSTRKQVAIGFTPNTMFYIKSRSGRDISRVSWSEREYEVLFRNDTKFKILSVDEGIEFGERVFTIKMEDL